MHKIHSTSYKCNGLYFNSKNCKFYANIKKSKIHETLKELCTWFWWKPFAYPIVYSTSAWMKNNKILFLERCVASLCANLLLFIDHIIHSVKPLYFLNINTLLVIEFMCRRRRRRSVCNKQRKLFCICWTWATNGNWFIYSKIDCRFFVLANVQ